MKKYVSSILSVLSVAGILTCSLHAMDGHSNQQPPERPNQTAIKQMIYNAMIQTGKTVAGVCAADTVCSLVETVVPASEATRSLICSAGLAGSLMVTKAVEKGIDSISLSDIAPSEVMTSHIKRKPTLAVAVTLLGFLHMYAQQIGVSPTVVYAALIVAKAGLFNDHKEALGYSTASSLYALIFALAYCGMSSVI